MTVASVLVVGGLMVVLDTTVMNVAIGHLSQAMGASLPVIQWVITGYTLALATVVPIMPWAVGRLGAKRVYLLALTLFVAGSVLAGLSWNVSTLIAFRVLQGLGGGLLMPVAMTIALRATRAAQRGRVMAIMGLPVLIGPVAGPALGGWILDTLSWRWIFFINLPIGLLAFVIAARALRPERPGPSGRLDVPGLLLLSPGLAALIYGLAKGGELGEITTARVWVPALAGAVLLIAFLARARTSTRPLVEVRLLRLTPMAAGAGVVALFAAAYFGSMFLVPLYYQVVRGETATASGLLMLPQALATGITMQVAGRLIDRVSGGRVIAVGLALAALGFVLFTTQVSATTPYWVLIAAQAVTGVGVGATLMPTMTTATRYLSPDDVPSGMTLLNITNQVAVSCGTAATSVLLGTALTSRLPDVVRTGIGDVYGLPRQSLRAIEDQLAAGIQAAFVLPVVLVGAALLVGLLFLFRTGEGRPVDPRTG